MSDFPDRPTHPDFKLLSEITIAYDRQSTAPGFDYQAFLAAVIDADSITYMATGRAKLMLRGYAGPAVSTAALARMATVYLDGFLAGHEFAKRKAEQEGEQ